MFYVVFGKQPSIMGPDAPATWVMVQGHDSQASADAQRDSLLEANAFEAVVVVSTAIVSGP